MNLSGVFFCIAFVRLLTLSTIKSSEEINVVRLAKEFVNKINLKTDVEDVVFGRMGLVCKYDEIAHRSFRIIKYYFRSKNNTNVEEKIYLKTGGGFQKNISFNPNEDTKIIIHGWIAGLPSNQTLLDMKEYLRIFRYDFAKAYHKNYNYNIIIVDWSILARDTYIHVSCNLLDVSTQVTDVIGTILATYNYSPKKLHIIGHSLGAQISGFIGRKIFQKFGVRVTRISALDPAKPNFNLFGLNSRLAKKDTDFMDVIHTDILSCGIEYPIGHVDFYPNGGIIQPGCEKFMMVSRSFCNHVRAYMYYIESITDPESFIGIKIWSNVTEVMGENTTLNARGIYQLQTNEKSPFGKGSKGSKRMDNLIPLID